MKKKKKGKGKGPVKAIKTNGGGGADI